MGTIGAFAVVALAGLACACPALADEQVLDDTFGEEGRAQLDASAGVDYAWVLVPDADGVWVLGGTNNEQGEFASYRVVLGRLQEDGTPDAAFNGSGLLVTGIEGTAYGGAFVDAQGRLVVQVRAPGDGPDGVARFLASGALDTSFAGDGMWESPGTGSDNLVVWDIAPAAGGGIWVSRQAVAGFVNLELVRLTADGTLDGGFPAFGQGDLPVVPAYSGGLEIDAQGRVLWAMTWGAAEFAPAVVRLTAAGALDTTFAGTGYAVADSACVSSGAFFAQLAALPGGTIVLRGDLAGGAGGTAAVVFRADGSAGDVRCEVAGSDFEASTALLARDRDSVLAASMACSETGCGPALRRFLVTPALDLVEDPAFTVTPALFPQPVSAPSPSGEAYAIALDPQHRPLVGGSVDRQGAGRDMAVARYGVIEPVFADGYEAQ